LMSFTTLQNHTSTRNKALRALKTILIYGDIKSDVVKKLISYLDENDYTNIISPTLEILISVPFQTRMSDLVIKLLSNPHETVRYFAIKKMRELNSPKVVRVLVESLMDGDSTIRDLAAESLCWLDLARTILLDKILEETDLSLCLLYAKILKPHASKFRSNQIKQLTERLFFHLDEDSPLQDPFLFLLKIAAPDYLYEGLSQRGHKLKQKKKFAEALKTLKLLPKNGFYGEDTLYDLAVCQLKVYLKDNKEKRRETDSSIPLYQNLIKKEDYPLLEKLINEKLLTHEDIYYLASQMMQKLQKERAFGSALLTMIANKHPRSRVGIASRKLLKENEL